MARNVAQDLLEKAHSPSVADTIFRDKVIHKPFRLRPTSPDPTSQDARAQRRSRRLRKNEKALRKHKIKPLSAKEKRVTGIYDISSEAQRYDIYVPLHQMWTEYMWEVLDMKEGESSFVTSQSAGSKLASADYHGAHLTVVRSPCVGMVGLNGIVLKDTKFTFQFITIKNELKVIPKKHTVFRFEIPQPTTKTEEPGGGTKSIDKVEDLPRQALVFDIHGSRFEQRATNRATKKMKQQSMNDL